MSVDVGSRSLWGTDGSETLTVVGCGGFGRLVVVGCRWLWGVGDSGTLMVVGHLWLWDVSGCGTLTVMGWWRLLAH